MDQATEPEVGQPNRARVARQFPQTAYAGMVKSLQREWQYLQQVTPGAAESFEPVKEALHNSFLPSLLEVEGIEKLRGLLGLSVHQAGMGLLLNPRATAEDSLNASQECTATLTESLLLKGMPLDATTYARDNAQHRRTLRRARNAVEAKAIELFHKSAGKADAITCSNQSRPEHGSLLRPTLSMAWSYPRRSS